MYQIDTYEDKYKQHAKNRGKGTAQQSYHMRHSESVAEDKA